MKAAPTTMVKDRGGGLTITTRGSSRNGFTQVIAEPALQQSLSGAPRAGATKSESGHAPRIAAGPIADVRFGSKRDIAAGPRHVRLSLKSRHSLGCLSRPLGANSGHQAYRPAGVTVLALRPNRSDEARRFLLGRKPSVRRQLVDDFGQPSAKAV